MPSIANNIRRVIVSALALVACSACAPRTYDSPNTLGVLPPQPPTPLWLGAVGSTNAGTASVTGAAAVTPSQTPGWAHVMISVDNGSAGSAYSWNLHSGSCSGQGSVIGPTDRYANFVIHADGSGAAEAVVPTTLSPSASYSIIATPVSPSTIPSACATLMAGSM